MGSCSGKAQAAPVITVRPGSKTSQRPESRNSEGVNNKYNETSINGERKDEENSQIENITGNYVKNNSQQDINTNNQQQYLVENKIGAQHERNKKEEDMSDLIEEAFASQLMQKQSGSAKQKNSENKEQSTDMFALNFPSNNFSENSKNELINAGQITEERRKIDFNKNKDKNLKDIINYPDQNEESFDSDNDMNSLKNKGNDNEFDVISERKGVPQKNTERNANEFSPEKRIDSIERREEVHVKTPEQKKREIHVTKIEVTQNMNKDKSHERVDSNKLESASPSSGNIRSKDILKEVQNENKQTQVIQLQKTPEKESYNNKKPRNWEPDAELEDFNRENEYDLAEEQIESPRTKKADKNKEKKSPLKESQKMPWEKSPGRFSQEDNEVEFFEEFEE